MSILELTSRERSDLRSAAHSLKPVVLIGDKGLSDAVIKEIDLALTAHGLIKVRAGGEDRASREALLAGICEALSCAPVHHLGKIFILYRPSANRPLPFLARGEDAAAAKPAKRKASEPHTPKKLAAEGKKLVKAPRRRAVEGDLDGDAATGAGARERGEPAARASRVLRQAGKAPRPGTSGTRKTASSSSSASHGVPRRSGSALSLRAGARRGPSPGRKTMRDFKKS